MSDYEVLTSKDTPKWTDYLSLLPIEQQDVYFTPEYYSLYEANGDGSARCFVFKKDGDIALYPFLLNRINDLGYDLDDEYYDIQSAYGYGGCVSSSVSKGMLLRFDEALTEYLTKQKVVTEFIRFHPLVNSMSLFSNRLGAILDRKVVTLNLNQLFDTIWQNAFSSNHRNKYRKSIKEGFYSHFIDAPCEVDALQFITLYKSTMKRVSADSYYYFSDSFIKQAILGMGGMSKLLMGYDLIRGVSSAMIVLDNGVYGHSFLSCTSDSSASYEKNHLYNEVVRDLSKTSTKCYNFGGGRTNKEDDSLLKFKMNFSRDTSGFYIGKKIHNERVYDQIKNQWKRKHSQSAVKYGHMLQGYRKLDA